MRVKYIGEEYEASLVRDKVYDVIGVEDGWYRIIDEDGVDEDDELPGYLYAPDLFEIVEE